MKSSEFPPNFDLSRGAICSRSAISSSIGSRHIETSVEGGERAAGPESATFLQPGDDLPRDTGIDLGDRLGDTPLKFSDDPQVDQRAADVELQPELLADFGGELEDGVLELGAIGPGFFGAIDRTAQLLVDHLLDVLEARGGVEFLVDHLGGAFEGDHFRGGDLERAHALGDCRLGDTEVARGIGLRVAGIEVAVEGVGVDSDFCRRMDLKTEAKLS